MAVLVNLITRAAKGSPLTPTEIDQNFLNLKEGIESSAPPGFNFVYNPSSDILSINNTVSGSDLDGVEMFANLGNAWMSFGGALSQVQANGSFMVHRPNTGVGYQHDGSNSSQTSIFILKTGDEEVLKVREDGVLIMKSFDNPPTVAKGGLYFDGDNFWQGDRD
tara:strand:- start:1777 stop:2268 length:492 start_codon:yes stop_codon:yes gene_type:complete